jgi:hypothetical protein
MAKSPHVVRLGGERMWLVLEAWCLWSMAWAWVPCMGGICRLAVVVLVGPVDP